MTTAVAKRDGVADGSATLAKAAAKRAKAIGALDEKVRRIREIQHGIHVSMWALGAALSDLHLRRDWEVRGTYANFTEFVRAEIGIPMPSVHRLIDISQRFTEEQARAYGVSRLIEIKQAPEKHWPDLLKLCEGGASVKELRSSVKAIKIACRTTSKTRIIVRHRNARGSTAAATIAAADKREETRVAKTAAAPPRLASQEWSIALMARRAPGDKSAKPAKRIGQQPTGSVVIAGAGTLTLSLFEGDGGAICVAAKFAPSGRQP